MNVPQLTPNDRADNLTARLVAIIIHEMTTCISRWREYAALKDTQLQQLYIENQQYKARIEAQCQTIHAQDERIRHLEFDMSPMELSCDTVSPAAFSMSLQGSETFDSVVDLQSRSVGETFGDALQETYGQASDDGNASIRDDVFAPLLALAMTAAEDTTGRSTEAKESPQTESKSPMKRHMEEVDVASKRVRHT
ncbi:hypothetical protein CDEST_01932 [Colletotrichum destructivum]|uniref:Uncharacterized protein n=1 Tax=Colletotrichum destructivum TaxID=34406 RepID=A0AAX4I1J3_9PEZI|nr:hypothetical protein CDEST_01932 [Colletotrichum destructivum]